MEGVCGDCHINIALLFTLYFFVLRGWNMNLFFSFISIIRCNNMSVCNFLFVKVVKCVQIQEVANDSSPTLNQEEANELKKLMHLSGSGVVSGHIAACRRTGRAK